MDDTQVKANPPAGGSNVKDDQGGQQQAQNPVQAPQVPVGGRVKEVPGVPTSQEWVSSSTPEVILPQEVKEAGVEAKPVMQPLSQDAHQAGVRYAKEATPVANMDNAQLGMQTPKSVLHHLKNAHKKVSEGITWLVRLIIKEEDKKERGGAL